MKPHSFGYLFGEGMRNIFRHKLMSFASVGATTACLAIIGVLVLVTGNINAIVAGAEAENAIIAFVDDFSAEESESETAAIRAELEKIENISGITYVSKAQALQEEKDRLGENAYLLDGFDEEKNPYPAHFVLTVSSLAGMEDTLAEIKEIPHIYQISSAESVTDFLLTIRNGVQVFGSAAFLALALVSLVVISNTVRLAVYSRRKEINIMKMVGATNTFIRMPFMVEGSVLGGFSGLLAFGILFGVYTALEQKVDFGGLRIGSFDGLLPFGEFAAALLVCFLLAGILSGLLSSVVSIQKHMRV